MKTSQARPTMLKHLSSLDTYQLLDQLDPLCVMAATIPSKGVYVVCVCDDNYVHNNITITTGYSIL